MANVKIDHEKISYLTGVDMQALYFIYYRRCLNRTLLEQYVYSHDPEKCVPVLHKMVNDGILEPTKYKNGDVAYFLTTLGVQIVKDWFSIPSEHQRQSYDLKIKSQNINHQMHLNSFVFAYEIKAKERGIPYDYYDQKFMPFYSEYMMPDGIIVLDNEILFLETDMGNERSAALILKWDNYRRFLNSTTRFTSANKKITMLFIIENVIRVWKRKDTIVGTLTKSLITQVNRDFEIYADTQEALLGILNEDDNELVLNIKKTLLNNYGFSISPGELPSLPYSFNSYIRKLSPARRIIVQHGRPQEYLLDIWLDGRFSILHKILAFGNITTFIKSKFKRTIPYIIVVPNEDYICRLVSRLQVKVNSNIYFVTEHRLTTLPLSLALFQVNVAGDIVE